MEKVRLGIIGCGHMGFEHVRGSKHLTNCVVTAVCDIDAEQAKNAADYIGESACYWTTDYTEITDRVDAVLIALPHDLHFPCGMYFVGKGKHILMEKPLCNSEEECLELVQAAEQAGVLLMCAYPVRHWPAVQMIKKIVDDKTYGDVIQMSIWTEQWTKDPGFDYSVAGLGGGQFFSHGCHYVDILLWILGEPVRGIHFGSRVGTPWLEGEGTSNMIMEFESGAMAYHFGTWGARGSKHNYDFQIHFTGGFLDYDAFEETVTFRKEWGEGLSDSEPRVITWQFPKTEEVHHVHLEAAHFADCIMGKAKPLITGRESVQSLRTVWKLYEAEKNGAIADLRGLGIKP